MTTKSAYYVVLRLFTIVIASASSDICLSISLNPNFPETSPSFSCFSLVSNILSHNFSCVAIGLNKVRNTHSIVAR